MAHKDPAQFVSYRKSSEPTPPNLSGNMSDKNGHAVPGSSWKNNYVPAYANGDKLGKRSLEPVEVAPEIEPEEHDRGQWGSKWEFVFSCVGLSVGIGNVWRFPYLAYENGGGAFLIPYIIILVLVGKPMYLMETAIGQYSQLGPMSMWSMAPIMKGVGAAMVVVSLIVAIYYNVIMAYTLFFTFASFQGGSAPWSDCHESFADDNCFVRNVTFPACKFLESRNITNFTEGVDCHNKTELAAEQYFKHFVLRLGDGLDTPGDIGGMNWQLTLCLLLSWIIVFFCLMKGVKSSGKVVYVTATAPYVFLIAILAYGCTLPGAIDGIKFFFIPEWEKLKDITVWQKAAEQMFFSLSVSWGGLIMFGSYNKFNNKVHIDSMVISSLDFVTSIIASVAIFSIMGSMAQSAGVKVDEVVKSGQGLAFIAFPEAIGGVPGWQLWSILFFVMLYTLGLDSEFALLETVTTAIYDSFPSTRNWKALVTLVASSSCFLLGLPCVSQSGPYVLHLMDTFGGLCVMLIAVFELIGIMWIYGVKRFSDNIQFMINYRPSMYFLVCWVLVAPLMLAAIFAYAMYEYEAPKYGDYVYPEWAVGVGWALAGVSIVQIPVWGVGALLYHTCKGEPGQAFRPLPSWGPGDKEARRRLLAVQQQLLRRDQLHGRDNPALEMERV
ncbi:sodium- and chloride-dependent neutral and basic amino acid transporter B(0+)-like isoform X2 [Pollicipes pollicipes]|uniref:sodium- and chloride-dependent neutral and basic amino acid transporter B(0+)-like isoform X2 n=1 Tax=Pollicipes pollicipes TaxID=41117 RepID=UPI0018853CAF|nr:sodium- and chloride-dependent neutral and basic amino acid transporter B(0+)-like isoform X2 [Pollicipes pollicipes]